MGGFRKLTRGLPGFRKQDGKKTTIVASAIYGFLLLTLVVLVVPTSPTLALEEKKPTRFSDTDIRGETFSNKPVFLLQNGAILLKTTSTTNGDFAFHLNKLPEGSHTYTVEVCNTNEMRHCESGQITVIVDKTPPIPPVLGSTEEETENETIKVVGEGEPGSKIKFLVNDEEEGETKTKEDGNFEGSVKLSEGENNIKAVSEDEAGNTSSSANEVVVNYTKPEVAGVQREKVKVTRVIDGDTIEIEGGKDVRYIGIDTPETKDPNQPVQCYGKEATDKNKDLVLNKEVELEKDVSETDKYDRLLRYVWVNGQMVNEILVREGYAQSSTYQPDVKYQEKFREAERKAREEGKGLWSDYCNNWGNTPTPTPTPKPVQGVKSTPTPSSGGYSCNCSKICSQMSSCEEAYYQLNTCGCSKRDGDDDGVPCESICPGG